MTDAEIATVIAEVRLHDETCARLRAWFKCPVEELTDTQIAGLLLLEHVTRDDR